MLRDVHRTATTKTGLRFPRQRQKVLPKPRQSAERYRLPKIRQTKEQSFSPRKNMDRLARDWKTIEVYKRLRSLSSIYTRKSLIPEKVRIHVPLIPYTHFFRTKLDGWQDEDP